jgi:hypothetical protein
MQTRANSDSRRSVAVKRLGTPVVLTACLIFATVEGFAQQQLASSSPALQTNMDGPAPVLRPLENGGRFEILQQQIDRRNFRHGTGCERIALRCPAGHTALLGFSLPKTPVISEFRAGLWLRSNRSGVQLAAQVVLPRSLNPQTGLPVELLVRGSTIGKGGDWEQLILSGLPNSLARIARVARIQTQGQIDEREAYVSQLVLLAPGGPGVSELLVDRIEFFGVVGDPHAGTTTAVSSEPPSTEAVSSNPHQPTTRPRVPRIIRWQGEPFELLARLGFQAVGLRRLPTNDELSQATKHGLSLVSPPPLPQQITEQGISEAFDPVLAWDLGDQLSADDLQQMVRWQQLIKRHDARDDRSTVLAPQLFTREASRIADIVLLDRSMLGSDLALRDYATWLTHRSRLARPGTPFWTRLDTQLSPQQANQVRGLGGSLGSSAVASYLQLTSLTSAAIGVKARGFYFDSNSSLAASDPATQQRAQALELINLRLGLLEPWLATGKTLASARSTQPNLTALVLQAERSQLLVPIWWSDNLTSVNPPPAAGPLSFIVPGVSESSDAYLLTLGGPQRLRPRRVTGGVKISLDSLPSDGLIMLTDDPGAFSQVVRYLRQNAPRATQLRRNLSAAHWQTSASVYPIVPSKEISQDELQASLAAAKQALQTCDQYAADRNYEMAYRQADAVEQILAQSDYLLWQETAAGQSVAENPLALGVATLGSLSRINNFLSHSPESENRLPLGSFEDLPSLLAAGWRHQQLAIEGIETAVRLSPTAPQNGTYCLELEARPLDTNAPAPLVPSSPVWVRSKPVRIRAGELIEITGSARVPEELLGSVDGLEIIDSLGGPELATRIKAAPSWQRFRMIRVATADVDLTVTIGLTGLGTAQVDDLAIRTLRLSGATPTASEQRPPLAVSR